MGQKKEDKSVNEEALHGKGTYFCASKKKPTPTSISYWTRTLAQHQ